MDYLNSILKEDKCINCPVDCDQRTQSFISSVELLKDEPKDITIPHNVLMFVLYGDVRIDNKSEDTYELATNSLIVLPAGSEIVALPRKNSLVIFCWLIDIYKFCPSFTLEELFRLKNGKKPGSRVLYCNTALQLAIEGAHYCIRDKFFCGSFGALKIKEILFLLCTYYSNEKLHGLFYPLLSSDLPFRTFIYENYKKINSVEQFASLSNMTKDGFIKKFKKIFGVTPGNWLIKGKKKRIKYELINTNKAFKEISYDHGFSHVGSFSKFCSKNFGLSPLQIRGVRANK